MFGLALLVGLTGPLPAGGEEGLTGPKVASPRPRPSFLEDLEAAQRQRVRVAFGLAIRALRRQQSCRDLFAPLALDGWSALAASSYSGARDPSIEKLCRQGSVAVTPVGGSPTSLCPRFELASRSAAAAVIIHEALHRAGLPEAPAEPAAESSVEISMRVRRACGL